MTAFLRTFRHKLIDCCIQDWHEQVSNSPKCEYYNHFKTMLNVERYIICNLPFTIRRALAKFRCSNHKLNIEVGRNSGIPREYRTCGHCIINNNSYCIEDEYHAFFNRSLYDDIRQNYLSVNLYNSKSLYEFY